MNERIQALKLQAIKLVAESYPCDIENFTDGLDERVRAKVDAKFAELIVRECFGEVMCQLYDYSPSSNEQYNAGHEAGLKLAVNKIKQHFGVEE